MTTSKTSAWNCIFILLDRLGRPGQEPVLGTVRMERLASCKDTNRYRTGRTRIEYLSWRDSIGGIYLHQGMQANAEAIVLALCLILE